MVLSFLRKVKKKKKCFEEIMSEIMFRKKAEITADYKITDCLCISKMPQSKKVRLKKNVLMLQNLSRHRYFEMFLYFDMPGSF